jgi:DNA polymerase
LANLKKVGGRKYAAHPSTQVLTVVALIDDLIVVGTPLLAEALPVEGLWPDGWPPQPVQTFAGPELPAPVAAALRAGRAICAHNTEGFDRHVWEAQGWPEPVRWVDPLPWSRAAGLPGSLDGVGQWLFGRGKDEAGKQLIRDYCIPQQPKGKGSRGKPPFLQDPPLEGWIALARYNIADVLLLAKAYLLLARYCEADVLVFDTGVNWRGITLDRGLAQALLALEDADTSRLATEAERLTGGAIKATDLDRVDHLGKWLEEQGYPRPRTAKGKRQLTGAQVQELLLRPDLSEDVRAVLEARAATGKVTTAKMKRALEEADPDGRLRHQFVYAGAHTLRWAGKGAQLHNPPKPARGLKAKDLERMLEAAGDFEAFRRSLPPGLSVAKALSSLLRLCFRAASGFVFLILDFAQIECRCASWLAGEHDFLARFARGDDVYLELAAKIFGWICTPGR